MSVNRISERYAKSLLEFAVEQGELDDVVRDVDILTQSLESRDLLLLIKSPIVATSKKQAIINKLFDGKLSKITLSFLKIILRKGREVVLPEMLTSFGVLYKAFKKVSTVLITTAQPLSERARDTIAAKLRASDQTLANVELRTEVDPDLIGGFTLEFEDKLYDSSVAAKLADMRRQFTQNNYQKTI